MASKIPFLFEILEQRNITSAQLAVAIGVSSGNVADWKSGRSAPKPEAIGKIADYLNCSTDYLLGRTAAPETTAPFLPQKEQQLLAAYKAHPELQFAVDKLLGINDEDTETVKIVARSEDDAPMTTEKVPKSKVKAALEDKSIQSDEDL